MSLVLAVVILGVAEVVILSLAFRAFERAEERRAQAGLLDPVRRGASPGRFFAEGPGVGLDRAPLEVLLRELEHHARLEQAAAESFLHNPTPESLHCRPVRTALHLAN